jgi:tryptophan synthase alpha chain
MNRLTRHLADLKSKNRKALSLYVTTGFPAADITTPLVLELAKSGADIIELGIPFSDPIADGPTIQQSSEAALRNGITLERTLSVAAEIRAQSDIPLVLMGYINPVYAYGIPRFIQHCSSIGIDGTIIPDLSLEESKEYRDIAERHQISPILLAAPTTTDERLIQLDNDSRGFLYCVSVTGVTGERTGIAHEAAKFIERTRNIVKKNPLLAGFGISSPDDARTVASRCDGVIIGSALIQLLGDQPQDSAIERASRFTRSLRTALDT